MNVQKLDLHLDCENEKNLGDHSGFCQNPTDGDRRTTTFLYLLDRNDFGRTGFPYFWRERLLSLFFGELWALVSPTASRQMNDRTFVNGGEQVGSHISKKIIIIAVCISCCCVGESGRVCDICY